MPKLPTITIEKTVLRDFASSQLKAENARLRAENERYRKMPGALDDACQWIAALTDPTDVLNDDTITQAKQFIANARALLAEEEPRA